MAGFHMEYGPSNKSRMQAMEIGERIRNTLWDRMEFAMMSLVPKNADPKEWLTLHDCRIVESVDGHSRTLWIDGRNVGGWTLVFDPGSVRIDLTGILALPPVCPMCCRTVIDRGLALPGHVCPGCESMMAFSRDAYAGAETMLPIKEPLSIVTPGNY